ncbi:hypothetical protein GQ44DRAFT_647074 [Phaeosphaeriaceae sp. PMI808]|nr:hypothetical protein GQ44DRAFT_647074 [Phaeosphaeriaceae sp. PMI808]
MDILAFAGIPLTLGGVGASEAVRRQRILDDEAELEERQEEFYLDVFCDAQSRKRHEVDDAIVVLKDGKLRLWPKDKKTKLPTSKDDGEDMPHPFTGFYLPFPPDDLPHRPIPYTPTLGLVSTVPSPINNEPKAEAVSRKPRLNWIYVDRETRELRYGPRAEAKKHIVGSWDWTEDEQGLTLQDEERLVAVEEKSGGYGWTVYWDQDDDRLKSIGIGNEKRVLRCSLERRLVEEKRVKGLGED